MKRRDRAVRTVLIGAAFASMATSAPPADHHEVAGAGTVRAPGGRFIRLVLDETSVAEADDIRIQIELQDDDGVSAVTLTPVGTGLGPVPLDGVVEYTLDDLCGERRPCTPELKLDAKGDGVAGVAVSVLMTRYGDPSFCFPDDRDFSNPQGSWVAFHD